MVFIDRKHAGQALSAALAKYRNDPDLLVLGLPRGGVTVAAEVAEALKAPLDILIVRKLGFPTNPELAIGALAETGAVALNDDIIGPYRVSGDYIQKEIDRQQLEIERRKTYYRSGKDIIHPAGKTVIVVDDGIATGATMKTALRSLRQENPKLLVAAAPVASEEAAREIRKMADDWVCLHIPVWFAAVGRFYRNFDQVEDEEVVTMLKQAQGARLKVQDKNLEP